MINIISIILFSILLIIPGMKQTHARVLLRAEEAIKQYFSDCTVKEESFFLTPEQIKKAENISSLKVDSKLLSRKMAICPSGEKYIYLDTHTVRTQKEVLMIVLNRTELEKVEVLSFYEPDQYLPAKKWYEIFKRVKKGEPALLGGNIPHISGASLTSRATVTAVNKIVALHEAIGHEKK